MPGLAKITGVVPGTVYNYINPFSDRQIGFDFAYGLLKTLGYNPFWLVFGEGEPRFPQEVMQQVTENTGTDYDHFEAVDRDRFFRKRIEKAKIEDIIEILLEMKRSEVKIFRAILLKMYPQTKKTPEEHNVPPE
ncbi:hypothetical protein LEP1GSC170_1475 [Leptospira interrogans serovar Bataviae str. HAI135]|nr:hypothetical protein LEP1GSC170_1475 [Leptospira interrogans serovar Bataviae str. HAI135]